MYAPCAFNNQGCLIIGGGSYTGNTFPVSGLQFYFNIGLISSGLIRVYGSI